VALASANPTIPVTVRPPVGIGLIERMAPLTVGLVLIPLATLGVTVGIVLLLCASKQVPIGVARGRLGLAARWIVAVVKDMEAGRNRTID
jgi:hypothetical protein